MSFGGSGVVDTLPCVDVSNPFYSQFEMVPRRFEAGGRLKIFDHAGIQNTTGITCVLCGGLISTQESSLEHPLPQWLMKYAGDSSELCAASFFTRDGTAATWRQLCLKSHKYCNETFATKIENPAIKSIKSIVEGRSLTGQQVDIVFDWFDKIKSTIVHMTTALDGHHNSFLDSDVSFPNRRVGLFDRKISIFKVDEKYPSLEVSECSNEGFRGTPSAIALKIYDTIMVYSSYNYMLSSSFGLGIASRVNGEAKFRPGIGNFPKTGLDSLEAIPGATVLAQPMRKQHSLEASGERHPALKPDGQGKVYSWSGSKWLPTKSVKFSNLTRFQAVEGYLLAAIEVNQSIISAKEIDNNMYPLESRVFMRSMPELKDNVENLRRRLFGYKTGLWLPGT